MIVPAPRFSNDDEAAEHWLTVLRDGNPEQKRRARERLAEIFERRQMFEEATELLISNIRDGERTADVFRWLARLYRAQGDEVKAMQAAAEAAKYMAPASPPIVVTPVSEYPASTASPPSLTPQSGGYAPEPGVCPVCGYTNRNPRGQCKRCKAPLAAAVTTGERHFGDRFSPQHAAGSAMPRKAGMSAKAAIGIGCLGVVGVLVLLGLISAAAGGGGASRSASAPSSTAAAKPVAEAAAPAAAAPTQVPATKPTAAPPTVAPKPTEKPAEKPSAVAAIGSRVESGGIALTVLGVRRANSLSQFMQAKPGRTFVIVDVTIENVTRDNAPYNPLYFKVKDSEGQEYNGSLIGPDNSLKAGELPKGDKVRGTVGFDVPAEARGLVISYQPVVIFGGYQTIRIQLE